MKAALFVGFVSAHKLIQHTGHACDWVDDDGDEVSTSLNADTLESDAF